MLTKAQAGGQAAAAVILQAMRGLSADRRCRAAADRRIEGRHGREPVAARPDAIAVVSVRRGPAAGAQRRLVRDGAAQPGQDARPARHLQGLHRAPAGYRGDGLRRGLSHADPPDRPHQPQGPQQRGDARPTAIPAAPTRSAPPRAATTRCIRNWARWRISASSSRPASALDMEVALDFAVQCSPDHPWLKQHPQWFRRRPDGSMRYAENPPKKYEDIVNPDFSSRGRRRAVECAARRGAVLDRPGRQIFRVDNPHTKPFRFWEWLIHEIQLRHPDVIFLAEAFTRPKLMKGLAKLGFTQSYTYFTWRTQKWELEQYLNELTAYPERDFYRPNFFVNTPDILPYHLQSGETWMFKSRVALAATLSAHLRHLQRLRAAGTRADSGPGGISRFRKIRDQGAGLGQAGQHQALHPRSQPRPPRKTRRCSRPANLRFIPIEDGNVIGFVKESVDQTNSVVVAIALSRDVARILASARRRPGRHARRPPPRRRGREPDHRRTLSASNGAASACGSIRRAIPRCCFAVWREDAP